MRAPNLAGSNMTFTALGKNIAQIVGFFDGTAGGEVMSFVHRKRIPASGSKTFVRLRLLRRTQLEDKLQNHFREAHR